MPDISMCLDHKCPLRETCYRYKATPSKWQSYTGFVYDCDACECIYYVEYVKGKNEQ